MLCVPPSRSPRASYSRRRFLGTAAAALAAPLIIPATALGRGGRVAPSERIVMGCIGVGGQGTRQMAGGIWSPAGGFISQPGVQIVAVCDVNAAHRQRARDIVNEKYGHQDCAAYVDFRELLARPDIDAILSATGERWHPLIALEAVKAGKDVYSEKPLSLSIGEARAVADAVRRYGRIFQIGTQQRSWYEFRFACELVRNGYIGEVRLVTADVDGNAAHCTLPGEPAPDPAVFHWDLWLGPSPWRPFNAKIPGSWMAWRDYSGGDMTNWGAHVFDIVQWGLGMDESGPVEILPPNGRDVPRLTYIYPNGVRCVRDRVPGHSKGIMFEGTRGVVKVSRERFETEPASLKKVRLGPNDLRLHEAYNHHTDFLDSVRSRRPPGANAEVACRSITVAHLGNLAEDLGRPLKWDPRRERFVNDPEADRFITRPLRAPWHL
jgi:predicted dehydrogenase